MKQRVPFFFEDLMDHLLSSQIWQAGPDTNAKNGAATVQYLKTTRRRLQIMRTDSSPNIYANEEAWHSQESRRFSRHKDLKIMQGPPQVV